MGKLIDEKVLQAYFKERFSEYTVEINGKKEQITGVTNGPDFPDLYCTINGKTVHCEVEWLSSNFVKHNHHTHKNFPDFKKHNGFLLVFDKDEQPVSGIQQIIVNEKDFKKWFKKNAGKIFDESVEEFKTGSEKRRKTAKVWIVYISPDMKKNFRTGIDDPKRTKTWGWPNNVPPFVGKELAKIKMDDLLVFFGPTINTGKNAKGINGKPNSGKSIYARMKGTYTELYKSHINKENYKIEQISVYRVKKGYWNESNVSKEEKREYEIIWDDETIDLQQYPHRVGLLEFAFALENVPLKKLNDATNEFLRTRMQGIAVGEMSYQNFIELIRK